MLKTFRYRVYPTDDQKQQLASYFGCARYVYNWALNERTKFYEVNKKSLSFNSLCKILTRLKRDGEHDWLKLAIADTLQSSLEDLDAAYRHFFKTRQGFPQYKTKHRTKDSLRFYQGVKLDFSNSMVCIPKMKRGIRAVFHRTFQGQVKHCSLVRTKADRFFVNVLVDIPEDKPKKAKVVSLETVGIDVGLKHFAVLSTGQKIGNPQFLNSQLHKLKRKQRKLKNKQAGSRRYEKAKLAIAKLHEHIANQRLDFLHKTSYQLCNENQVHSLAIEDLCVSGMLMNKRLAKHIFDVSWSKFRQLLTYKCDWYGKNLLVIDRFAPSSKQCSVCGYKKQDLTLACRMWVCPACNTEHDRDINAARNIKNFALKDFTEPARLEVLVEDPLPGTTSVLSRHGSVKREAEAALVV